ncbi:MAG: hypothetical protein PVG39_16340 [Desulfobacteraceae bacterium]
MASNRYWTPMSANIKPKIKYKNIPQSRAAWEECYFFAALDGACTTLLHNIENKMIKKKLD